MPSLSPDLRKTLENAIISARRAAEEAARTSLVTLAVSRAEAFGTMNEAQRQLRRGLRAKARQLGDNTKSSDLPLLTYEVAYQQWHRMLFARFLAENDLLMHPVLGVPISLEECAELAADEEDADAWDLAARYASGMLPGIFPASDPAVLVRFAPEGRQKLESILASLPSAVFTADDGLGWVYQFWQTDKKKEVNASGRKIGGADLSPVTQIFTEDYMVRFLLENSLGAWWAARHPESPLVKTFEFLRYQDDGTPAAGTFPGWPDRAAHVTIMDPCGGSGHFKVAEFGMMLRMRMEEEEGLSVADAGDAVIRDNLFMLELDPRCTQIATFALVLAAWKSGGYRPLPTPNIVCSGIAVTGQLEDWLRLAGEDERLRTALERLHKLFRDAPTLGSLINPADVPLNERMFSADYEEVAPLLTRALAKERDDPTAAVLGAAAVGVSRAAKLLAGQYTLVATNVPYLQSGKQKEALFTFCRGNYRDSAADLATVFVERCRGYTQVAGSYALVTPQNWLFLSSYQRLRGHYLKTQQWNHVSWLGPRAFETITGEVVKPVLVILTNSPPSATEAITGIDASTGKNAQAKSTLLQEASVNVTEQTAQLDNPDVRIIIEKVSRGPLLETYAYSYKGITSGDDLRYRRKFWEAPDIPYGWRFLQSTVKETVLYGGCEHILWLAAMIDTMELAEADVDFSDNTFLRQRQISKLSGVYIRAVDTWGKRGVAVSQMSNLPCALSVGEPFDTNTAVILPKEMEHLAAVWAFCASPDFKVAVRKIDKKLNVTNSTLAKVPFDLDHWKKVADLAGPLPEPYSNDPTQWLFGGHTADATEPMQVAVARLLGYDWPQQVGDNLGTHADADGIVCLPAVGGEAPAAERLRSLLATAYGTAWSATLQEHLLALSSFAGKTLEDWLADDFFAHHCRIFHNRPFIWHIWDGRKDGFAALVNYHRLDRANLEKLIYTYLGIWIARQRDERDAGVPAADGRLVAALELQKKLIAILEGESPYDIYVRWKPLHQQAIGWDPDLNDGVRLNIRPFVTAGVLRSRFTINWNKDRGTNPDRSERINDRHPTRLEKQVARRATHQGAV